MSRTALAIAAVIAASLSLSSCGTITPRDKDGPCEHTVQCRVGLACHCRLRVCVEEKDPQFLQQCGPDRGMKMDGTMKVEGTMTMEGTMKMDATKMDAMKKMDRPMNMDNPMKMDTGTKADMKM